MSIWPERFAPDSFALGLSLACCVTVAWAQPAARATAAAPAAAVAATPAMKQAVTAAAARYPSIGRAALPQEVAAWDIDVRPDFKGLPKGSGSVAQGQVVWEAQCASCHGVFGESNAFFTPLVGGTTAADIKSGHVARLNDPAFPGRTTLMKLSSVSTLWDYIRRAMPWNQPKSLSTEQVYAVTAYVLNLGGVLPDDYVLSDTTIADVQKLLPNRNGLTTQHSLWPGRGWGNATKPDVQARACMKNCAPEPEVGSFLPEFALGNNGNLALQQRQVGPLRGLETGGPVPASTSGAASTPAPAHAAALALLQTHSCTACHGMERAVLGPGLREVAARYAQRADAAKYLAAKIKAGGQGVWGAMAMPPQNLTDEEADTLGRWLAAGAPDK